MDAATRKYLDDHFAQVLSRVDRPVQRVGGRTNAVYNNSNPDFQKLIMAREVLAAITASTPAVAVQLDLSSATPEQMDQLGAAVARHLASMRPDSGAQPEGLAP